jgi:serine/threonine protein kinase
MTMNEPHDMPPPDDPAFELLNQYLERLHRGEKPDRQRLLAEHPELAAHLQCLEALDALAPPQKSSPQDPSRQDRERADTPLSDLTATLLDSGSGPQAPAAGPADVLRQLGDFGDYELLEEIGRGGMGVVYKARQKSLDRIVAVKMIAQLLATREQVRRFQSEAKAAAGINHPHVVHIHEVGEIYGQHYFAMEYVPGTTLAKRLDAARAASERLPIDEAVSLLCAVAHAVEYLHQHGVVHRDLKPSNILLDNEGKPKVTDFGLAKVSTPGSRESAPGVIAGTPHYMSPEQAMGDRGEVGPLTDVYSLGAILYELLTGRPPFRGDNPLDVLLQVREREPAKPRQVNPKVPYELELICLKCLEKSPGDRYPSAGALAEDLERYLRRETIEATPPSVLQQAWRWARREPALATRVGALVLFYLAVTAFFFRPGSDVDREYYLGTSLIVVVWMMASIVFQRLLTRRRWELAARFLWGILDTLLLLAVLLLGDGVASPMVVGFPLLIVAAGLWSHVRLVWFVTGLSLVAYATLVAKYYHYLAPYAAGTKRDFDYHFDRHVYFLISLLLCGCLVAYQVSRTRALNRYFEKRRM